MAEAVAAALAEERAMRLAALRTALAPAAIEIAAEPPAAGDAETGATVLLAAGCEAALEAALSRLPPEAQDGASADLRGPLPPLLFAPLRVAELEPAAVTAAWRLLDLPDRLGTEELTRRWRALARELHPDTGAAAADPARLDAAGQAYRLLRGLAAARGELDLAALAARAGRHLAIPAPSAAEAA
ncbi:J domain-containing protein [Paracraurococcus ruber]|nr:J domain-containing protein [Paracraurococcus ruber]